jgi:prolyl oligopeptidase
VLFAPTERSSLAGFSPTRNHILLNVLDNVKNRIYVLTPGKDGWQREPLPGLPEFGTDRRRRDRRRDERRLLPHDHRLPDADQPAARHDRQGAAAAAEEPAGVLRRHRPRGQPARGDQSKDGTRVPYFLVAKKDLPRDGKNPTLLYGYGGFEVSMTPGYSAGVGAAG